MMSKDKIENLSAMTKLLCHTINLAEFIETEAGCRLLWKQRDRNASTLCPMPWHNDSKASFCINLMDDGVWVYHCFGCEASGNLITFCIEYLGKESCDEAVKYLMERYNVNEVSEAELLAYKFAVKSVDRKKQMEGANILTSNQCRELLRTDFKKNQKWVSEAYRRLNKALYENDGQLIEDIGHEASQRMCIGE